MCLPPKSASGQQAALRRGVDRTDGRSRIKMWKGCAPSMDGGRAPKTHDFVLQDQLLALEFSDPERVGGRMSKFSVDLLLNGGMAPPQLI